MLYTYELGMIPNSIGIISRGGKGESNTVPVIYIDTTVFNLWNFYISSGLMRQTFNLNICLSKMFMDMFLFTFHRKNGWIEFDETLHKAGWYNWSED